MRILGIDPGLNHTGWGCIDYSNNHLSFVACGRISTKAKDSFAQRLHTIFQGLQSVIVECQPIEVAIEETFVNNNAATALKLGMARGVAFIAPAEAGLPVSEYAANKVKKSLVGAGHADKAQIQMMVRTLLPTAQMDSADAADALAIAICHAHHRDSRDLGGAICLQG